jgi:hypothetical protein
MKPSASEHDEQDRDMIRLLEELGSFQSTYPPELQAARRAAFLAQVEQLSTVELDEGLSAEDEEIVHLLGILKSAQAEYPADLLAARRSALLQQIDAAGSPSVWDQLCVSIQRILPYKTAIPSASVPGFMRISLVIGSLIVAVFLGSLFFSRTGAGQSFQPFLPQGAAAPTSVLPTSASEAAILICRPDAQAPSCPPGELDPSQDLADPGNGAALPAVSKDARANPNGTHKAAYVNDGRGGASWVSNSADSWIKIDLGNVTTINTVSLQNGSLDSSDNNHPGQFVIAVALSDVYADGDSSNDYVEYAQVFHSEQADFSGRVSPAETIRTHFAPVQARYVKITFEQAGAAIEEVGIFLVKPPVLAEQTTRTPQDDLLASTMTPIHANTLSSMGTPTSAPTGTAIPRLTNTPSQAASDTPVPSPTTTRPPADTSTPFSKDPLPSETPIPLLTAVPSTAIPSTAVPPIVQPPPPGTDPIIVNGSDQTLTFTCNGNAAEVRGHANAITLLGSCSSITVKGNGNHVFWQSGSPVITNKGNDNIILQLE